MSDLDRIVQEEMHCICHPAYSSRNLLDPACRHDDRDAIIERVREFFRPLLEDHADRCPHCGDGAGQSWRTPACEVYEKERKEHE